MAVLKHLLPPAQNLKMEELYSRAWSAGAKHTSAPSTAAGGAEPFWDLAPKQVP